MVYDTHLYDHLSELVLACSHGGEIHFANAAAQHVADEPLIGQHFTTLLIPSAIGKARAFLAAVQQADPAMPTSAWELPLGDEIHYQIARFRGYRDGDDLVIIGEIEAAEVSTMQQELLALTTELSQAQRDQRRQNQLLQQALDKQTSLLQTIQELTTPAVRIWDRVLLLPLFGHLDRQRTTQITTQLLERVTETHAAYVILDVSGIALIDTAVAQQLIQTSQALRLLGVQPILVGINPEIAQTIVNLGLELVGMRIYADLSRALADVITRLNSKL